MTYSEALQTKQDTLYGQIRQLTDRQLRLVVYLVVDGWSLSDALDLLFKHFNIPQEGKST